MRSLFGRLKRFFGKLNGKTSEIITITSGLAALVTFGLQLPSLWKEYNKKDTNKNPASEQLYCQEVFKNTENYNILILPFFKPCETGRDIGFEIRNRLEMLKYKDSLSINVCYLDSFKQNPNFTIEQANNLRKKYKADQIIYGTNNSLNCTPQDTILEVCVNYLVEDSNPQVTTVPINQVKASLTEIRQGFLQADIDFIVYYFSALSDYEKGLYKSSLLKLTKINKQNFSGDYYSLKGSLYENLGNYDSTLTCYNKAVLYDPTPEHLIKRASFCRRFLKDYESAIKDSEYVLSIANTHYSKCDAFFELTVAHYVAGNTGKCLSYANSYIEESKNDSALSENRCNIYTIKGLVLEIVKNNDESSKCYEEALKISPKNQLALESTAKLYEKQFDYDEALKIYNQLVTLYPKEAKYYIGRGGISELNNDYNSAKKDFVNALKISNYSARTYRILGARMRDLKRYWDSLKLLRNARSIEPNEADTYFELGMTYSELDFREDAVKNYDICLYFEPSTSEAIFNKGILYFEMSKYKDAVKAFDSYLESNKQLAYKVYYYRGLCKLKLGIKDGISDVKRSSEMGMTLGTNFLSVSEDSTYSK